MGRWVEEEGRAPRRKPGGSPAAARLPGIQAKTRTGWTLFGGGGGVQREMGGSDRMTARLELQKGRGKNAASYL